MARLMTLIASALAVTPTFALRSTPFLDSDPSDVTPATVPAPHDAGPQGQVPVAPHNGTVIVRHVRELGEFDGWQDARCTWYGGPGGPGPDGMSIFTGSCGYKDHIPPPYYVAAAQTMGGYSTGLTGSCGKCYEVACVDGKTRGTASSQLGPWKARQPACARRRRLASAACPLPPAEFTSRAATTPAGARWWSRSATPGAYGARPSLTQADFCLPSPCNHPNPSNKKVRAACFLLRSQPDPGLGSGAAVMRCISTSPIVPSMSLPNVRAAWWTLRRGKCLAQ